MSIRYFNAPESRTAIALMCEPGSFAEKAPAGEFEKQFGLRLIEIGHKDYRHLVALYEEENLVCQGKR